MDDEDGLVNSCKPSRCYGKANNTVSGSECGGWCQVDSIICFHRVYLKYWEDHNRHTKLTIILLFS